MTGLIHAQTIDAFNAGKWRVMCVTAPGTIPVLTKEGTVDAPYAAGDAILVDAGDKAIAGPVNLTGALDLAERVLDCNAHVRTDTRTLLALATAEALIDAGRLDDVFL